MLNATAPMTNDGGFAYTFQIPGRTAAGKGAVTAVPYNINWCDDTGKNDRVTGSVEAALERESCVLPVQTLTITR